jgi:hypothetical protein
MMELPHLGTSIRKSIEVVVLACMALLAGGAAPTRTTAPAQTSPASQPAPVQTKASGQTTTPGQTPAPTQTNQPAQAKTLEGRITLQIAPPQISLVPDSGPVVAVVQAEIPAGDSIDNVRLNVPKLDGINVEVQPRDEKGPGDLLWDLRVSAEYGSVGDVQVPVIVSWRAGKDDLRRTAVASFHVVIQPPLSASVTLRLQTEFAELTEFGNHRMTLFVENKSRLPLKIAGIQPLSGPEFIHVDFPLNDSQVVPPGELVAISGTAALKGDYTTQSHDLELKVNFTSENGRIHFDKTIASPILVAIPGLGDALKLVEAPSLIFLPGLITLVAAASLRARLFRWRKADGADKDNDWKTPGFWIVAITLSGVISWAAYRVAGVDFSDSYRFGQLIILWALSLSIFPIFYLLWNWGLGLPIGWASRVMKFLLLDRYTVTERDDALALLEKLYLNRSGFYIRSVYMNLLGTTQQLFILSDLDAPEGKKWVIPGLVVTGNRYPFNEAGRLDQLLNDQSKARELFDTLLTDCGRPLSLAGAAWARLKPSPRKLTVSFEPGSIGQPFQLAADDPSIAVIKRSAPRSILRRGRTW